MGLVRSIRTRPFLVRPLAILLVVVLTWAVEHGFKAVLELF
jgi:hypothetical protein